MASKQVVAPFKPRARLLQLLGDELIGSARLAVFELVKNAYDADASRVVVTIDLPSEGDASITVSDDGEGMTIDTIRDVWLVPGDDHRSKQRLAMRRTTKFHRLPLGEKGLGRFAVHKLGAQITLTTRAKGADECIVAIDWSELTATPFLEDAPVTIKVRAPKTFEGKKTGTQVRIDKLRQDWTRGEIRRLQKQITTICSPFEEPSGFTASLDVPGHPEWISDLPDVAEILSRALYKYSFALRGDTFTWKYEFTPPPGMKLSPREAGMENDALKLPPGHRSLHESKIVADASMTSGIGPVTGTFYVFDRDRDVLRYFTETQLTSGFLDDQGGVRVYRDGIRVYNYGEPGEDWLGLDLRRVNAPTQRVSRNIIVGAVNLDLAHSTSLVEKTNREGFVENSAYYRLQRIVIGSLGAMEAERSIDKDRIRLLAQTKEARGTTRTLSISKPIAELRGAIASHKLTSQLEPYIAKIESDFAEMQNTLLSAGMSGLNLAVVFHEVERGVRALHSALSAGAAADDASRQARELMQLLDGFATLLRRDTKKRHSARELIEAARRFNVARFRHHRVILNAPLLETNEKGFQSTFAFGLVLGALNNLIDNSMYWMRVRWPDKEAGAGRRRLFLGVTDTFESGPALVVADNGPGLGTDDPERLVRPFFTRKPAGMGLGLYYSSLAMELNGGELVFPDPGDVEVPSEFDGAVVALSFKRPA